jgi:predicted glutamine amidotransferase
MCRLFFLYKTKHQLSEKMRAFLKQSHHKRKNTPGLNNPRDHLNHMDGFGFAWTGSTKSPHWLVFKHNQSYKSLSDITISKKLKEITDDKPEMIIGHIRNATDSADTLENTHPFSHKHHVFVQNGYIGSFREHRDSLHKLVSKKYHAHILGDTDTELLFYMLLTLQHKTSSILTAFRQLFAIFQSMRIEISANLIYANEKQVIITRFLYQNGPDNIPASLYYSTDDGLVLASEPVDEKMTWVLMPENTAIIIDDGRIQSKCIYSDKDLK